MLAWCTASSRYVSGNEDLLICENQTHGSSVHQTYLRSHCLHHRSILLGYSGQCCYIWTGPHCMLHSHRNTVTKWKTYAFCTLFLAYWILIALFINVHRRKTINPNQSISLHVHRFRCCQLRWTVSVINWRRSSVTSLSHWQSTSVYTTVGVRHRVEHVCQWQQRLLICENQTHGSSVRQTYLRSHCLRHRPILLGYSGQCCYIWTGSHCMLHSHTNTVNKWKNTPFVHSFWRIEYWSHFT